MPARPVEYAGCPRPEKGDPVHWIFLAVAGAFEIVFTACLKMSDGFTRLWWSLAFVAFAIFSFYFLNLAIDVVPLGTAYAIWTGVGAAGTAAVGMVFFKEPATLARGALIFALVAAVVGLKFISVD